ncbi:MAG: ADP-ribosylation factor-like protein [Promethearchaeota archaeon]
MENLKFKLWELGGRDEFASQKASYLASASGIVLVFDITNLQTLAELDYYLAGIVEVRADFPLVLVGNKVDLVGDVPEGEVRAWCAQRNVTQFVPVSALTGQDIPLVFQKLSSMVKTDYKVKGWQFPAGEAGEANLHVLVIGPLGVGKSTLIERYEAFPMGSGGLAEPVLGRPAQEKTKAAVSLARTPSISHEKIPPAPGAPPPGAPAPGAPAPGAPAPGAPAPGAPPPGAPAPGAPPPGAPPPGAPPPGAPTHPPPPKPIVKTLKKTPGKKNSLEGLQIGEMGMPSGAKFEEEPLGEVLDGLREGEILAIDLDDEEGDVVEADDAQKFEETRALAKKEKRGQTSKTVKAEVKKGPPAGPPASTGGEVETVVVEKVLERKSTVFYNKQMNPLTRNKLSVVLSSKKIYEELKRARVDAQRTASDKTLKIKESSPFVHVEPHFPGCVVTPPMIPLDARKDSDTADFVVTPLTTGKIPDACVKLYYEGTLIDTIQTPTKVVKQTVAKASALVALVAPILSSPLEDSYGAFFSNIIPYYAEIGGLEGILMALASVLAVLGSVFYFMKRPRKAGPVEANFPTLDEIVEMAKYSGLDELLDGRKAKWTR